MKERKRKFLGLLICVLLMTGCGNGQDERASSISDAHASEAALETFEEISCEESETPDSTEPVQNYITESGYSSSDSETEEAELPAYLGKMSVYFDENGGVILDNGGFLYRYIINSGISESDTSTLDLVFGEPYEEVINYSKAFCYPIELLAEPENILLGTLVQGIYFYPNSEYFDEEYLRDKVAGINSIYGYIDSVSQEAVFVFTGEENWLYDDTYLELINVSDTVIEMPLADNVHFALLDRNFACTEVTAERFQQTIDNRRQENTGAIFSLYLEDGKIIQIQQHYNP